jgi:hypothetical protein
MTERRCAVSEVGLLLREVMRRGLEERTGRTSDDPRASAFYIGIAHVSGNYRLQSCILASDMRLDVRKRTTLLPSTFSPRGCGESPPVAARCWGGPLGSGGEWSLHARIRGLSLIVGCDWARVLVELSISPDGNAQMAKRLNPDPDATWRSPPSRLLRG